MSVVYEKKILNGIVRIHDDAYRDIPPEEMERRREEVRRIAGRMLAKIPRDVKPD